VKDCERGTVKLDSKFFSKKDKFVYFYMGYGGGGRDLGDPERSSLHSSHFFCF